MPVPLLHTLLSATAFKSPFLSTLIPSIGLAYGIQAAVAIPSILAQSEKFYDLSGSLTYLSCTALSLYLPTLRARAAASAAVGATKPAWPSVLAALRGGAGAGLNWRQVVLSAAVGIWATRRTFQASIYSSSTPYLELTYIRQSEPTSSAASPPTAPTPASTISATHPPNSSAPSAPQHPGAPAACSPSSPSTPCPSPSSPPSPPSSPSPT